MKYIYKIVNDLNSKVYIGQTTRSLEVRFHQHQMNALSSKYDFKIYRAMRKYGVEHFAIELVEEVAEEASLDERERYWIEYYNALHQGYNSTEGGNAFGPDANPMHLEECRQKVSEFQRTRIDHP